MSALISSLSRPRSRPQSLTRFYSTKKFEKTFSQIVTVVRLAKFRGFESVTVTVNESVLSNPSLIPSRSLLPLNGPLISMASCNPQTQNKNISKFYRYYETKTMTHNHLTVTILLVIMSHHHSHFSKNRNYLLWYK